MALPVALFVPNLIGYVRVISGLLSFVYAFDNYWVFIGLYAFSMGLDAVDGVAARALHQSECPHAQVWWHGPAPCSVAAMRLLRPGMTLALCLCR